MDQDERREQRFQNIALCSGLLFTVAIYGSPSYLPYIDESTKEKIANWEMTI